MAVAKGLAWSLWMKCVKYVNMNKDNSTNSKFKTVIWRLVSAIALVLSIIAICGLYYRTTDLGIDYIGIIVGILAILVTCLVAWNIYSAIDANKKIDEMRNELNAIKSSIDIDKIKYEKSINTLKAELYDNVVSIDRYSLGFEKASVATNLLINMISSIEYLIRSEEYKKAELQLDFYYAMLQDKITILRQDVDKDTSLGLLRLLYEIPNKGKLKNFSKLEELIKLTCS